MMRFVKLPNLALVMAAVAITTVASLAFLSINDDEAEAAHHDHDRG